jgi:endonuclease YncB( thermonuclease family)
MLRLAIVFLFGLWLRAESFTGLVIAVADGDTITVMHDGVPERVRLYGIDAPEKKQPFFQQAKGYIADLSFQKTVTVRVKDRDRWHRSVGEVILPDRRLLNHEAVRAGYAWWFRKYAKGDDVLQSLEDQARTAKRGLWSGSEAPVPPWEWRAFYSSGNALSIN